MANGNGQRAVFQPVFHAVSLVIHANLLIQTFSHTSPFPHTFRKRQPLKKPSFMVQPLDNPATKVRGSVGLTLVCTFFTPIQTSVPFPPAQ